MKKLVSSFTSLVTYVFVVLSGFFDSPLHAEEAKTFRVGAVLSLTGMASAHGRAIQDGLEFAKSELETKGWKIVIQYEDDTTAPRQTVSAIQRLVSLGTRLFIGPTWGILAIPAAPVIDAAGAISLQPVNSSEFVKGVSDQYFFFYPPPSRAANQLLEFLRPYRGRKVAIFNNISPWGELWGRLFTKAAKDSGAELVATEMLEFSELDQSVPTIVTKFRQLGVEVILSTTSKEAEALTIKTLEAQRVSSVFLGLDLADAASEGLIAYSSSFVKGFSMTEKQRPEFIASYRSWKGRDPWRYTSFAYDALIALTTAVERVGSNPERIKRFLKQSLNIDGASGRLRFDESHDITGTEYEILKVIERTERSL